jgi:hypothetical protein
VDEGFRGTGFRRSAGMLPLPVPEPGGSIEILWSFINLPSRNDFVLIAFVRLTGRLGDIWDLRWLDED